MKSVAQMLKQKPAGVVSIRPDVPVLEALKLLSERGVGAVLVIDGSRVAGIVSERDYTRKVELKGKSASTTPVSEIMTKEVICVTPEQTNEECMALMTGKRLRHLPVIENGKVVGILSIGDLVKEVISEQKFIIEQLEHYISGDLA